MRELTIEAKTEHLEQVLSFIDKELETVDCSMKFQLQINVAVEELFVNIAHYAYRDETGLVRISVELTKDAVHITFSDSGMPYNPLKKPDPDTTLSAKERPIGGLGIYLVKKSMDNVLYEYVNGENRLCIQKKL